ncbi:MAG TPA: hypothetical protein VLI90_19285, partial [Tepidisphaeraceae bacterium]|nr:hypothetical protein [Tepidisphaeraceae bacterium]
IRVVIGPGEDVSGRVRDQDKYALRVTRYESRLYARIHVITQSRICLPTFPIVHQVKSGKTQL